MDQTADRDQPTGADQASVIGLRILAGAIAIGALGDALLRAWPPGLNVLLWVASLAAALVGIGLRGRMWQGRPGGWWLVVPALVFAGSFALRDATTLLLLNLGGLLVAASLVAAFPRGERLRNTGFVGYGWALFLAGLNWCFGALALLFGSIHWHQLPSGRLTSLGVPVVRGVFVAAPLTFVFGGLFVAADAAFESWAGRLLDWNLEETILHALVATVIGWLVAGWLHQALLSDEGEDAVQGQSTVISIGRIELGIVLGSLCILFLAFVVVQFRYFFGGADLVEASPTLTYAEYARRGFFELVAVAGLLLPVLLTAHWALRPDDALAERLFQVLGGALLLLLCVVVASALQRMRLYVDAFGLTELRLYTTALMAWLVVVFAWFAATVLRGRREPFAFGALIAGFLAIGLLNLASPDEVIARVNTGVGYWGLGVGAERHSGNPPGPQHPTPSTHPVSGWPARGAVARPVDAYYLTNLSADAVPALLEALPALPASEQRVIAQRLAQRWSPPKETDWRSWNWARNRARQAVNDHWTLLAEAAR